MNKQDLEEIREYILDKLEFQKDGSYPKEKKILGKILVMTTECLDTQQVNESPQILFHESLPVETSPSSSKAKTISGNDLCECGHTRDVHTHIGCDSTKNPDCFCSRFKSKTKSEDSK